MAKTNGLVGGVTGKIGNVIGYYRRGKYLARAYNPHTTNVRSRLQQRQRARWITLMEFLRPAIELLRIGFHYDTPGYELPNAMKENMPNVTNSNPIDTEITYTDIQLSKGKFEGWANQGAITSNNGAVQIGIGKIEGWESVLPTDYGMGADANLKIGVYNTVQKKWMNFSEMYDSITDKVTINLPIGWSGEKCHFYGFLACPPIRALGEGIPDYCSNTLYLGEATIE